MKKIGIFGGTFNPVHYGHLRVALECKQALELDEMRMMICAQPPHREYPGVSAVQRKAMLELALVDSAELMLDARELDREGLSYSVDTLESLKCEFPDAALFMVIGSDSFQSFSSWHRWQHIMDLCNLVIARRPDNVADETSLMGKQLSNHFVKNLSEANKFEYGKVIPVGVSQLEISSTNIRCLIQQNKSPKYLLPDSVLDYIIENSLFK